MRRTAEGRRGVLSDLRSESHSLQRYTGGFLFFAAADDYRRSCCRRQAAGSKESFSVCENHNRDRFARAYVGRQYRFNGRFQCFRQQHGQQPTGKFWDGSDEESVSAYVAYLERLQQYSSGIETLENENENNKNNISAALIALADIVGDEKEELIFLACETNPGTEKLHIFSYDQGEAKELYADKLPIYAGQGLQPFMLFTLKGDKTLWLYRQTADESEISTYFEFEADSDLYLTKSERYRKTALMEWVKTDGVRVDHRKDQEHCSEEVYNKADEYYHQNIDRAVLVGADLFDEAYRQYVSDYHPKHCYTYAGAVKTLNEHIDSLTGNLSE